jgi:hypothetical protein
MASAFHVAAWNPRFLCFDFASTVLVRVGVWAARLRDFGLLPREARCEPAGEAPPPAWECERTSSANCSIAFSGGPLDFIVSACGCLR